MDTLKSRRIIVIRFTTECDEFLPPRRNRHVPLQLIDPSVEPSNVVNPPDLPPQNRLDLRRRWSARHYESLTPRMNIQPVTGCPSRRPRFAHPMTSLYQHQTMLLHSQNNLFLERPHMFAQTFPYPLVGPFQKSPSFQFSCD